MYNAYHVIQSNTVMQVKEIEIIKEMESKYINLVFLSRLSLLIRYYSVTCHFIISSPIEHVRMTPSYHHALLKAIVIIFTRDVRLET